MSPLLLHGVETAADEDLHGLIESVAERAYQEVHQAYRCDSENVAANSIGGKSQSQQGHHSDTRNNEDLVHGIEVPRYPLIVFHLLQYLLLEQVPTKHEGAEGPAHAPNEDEGNRKEESFHLGLENLAVRERYDYVRGSLRDRKDDRERVNQDDGAHGLVRVVAHPQDEQVEPSSHLFEVEYAHENNHEE